MDPNLLQAIMAYLSQMAQGGQDPGAMQDPTMLQGQSPMMDPMSQGSMAQDPMMMQEPMAQEQPQGLPPGIGKILAAVLASMQQQQGALQQAPTLGTASSMSNVP